MSIIVAAAASTFPPLILNSQLTQGTYRGVLIVPIERLHCKTIDSFLPPRVVGHCRACKELDNQARAREDFSEYRAMLKAIRRAEEGRREESHFIFLIQVTGAPALCCLCCKRLQ